MCIRDRLHRENVDSAEQRKAPDGWPSFTVFRACRTLGDSNLSGVWRECAADYRVTFRFSECRFRRCLFPGAYSQLQFLHDVLGAGFPADGVFCGRNEGEIGHIRCGGWRQYGYIYEKERSRLAKIEKMAEALEKKLIFLPKNDSL